MSFRFIIFSIVIVYTLLFGFIKFLIGDYGGWSDSGIVASQMIAFLIIIGAIYMGTTDDNGRIIKSLNKYYYDHQSNFIFYLCIFFIVLYFRFDPFHIVAEIIYLGIISFLIAISIIFIYHILKGIIKSSRFFDGTEWTSIAILIVLGYFLFVWGKNVYVDYHGNEIIGNYWEKPVYRTRHNVIVFESFDSPPYDTLLGQIYVHTQGRINHDDYAEVDRGGLLSQKVYTLEGLFMDDGRYISLESSYQPCNLSLNGRISCWDQNEKNWYVELMDVAD